MLGLAPLSSVPIAGSPFRLLATTLAMAATGGLSFSGTANAGAYIPMSAIGGVAFGGTARPSWTQRILASGGLTFGGSPTLRLAGKPLIVTALSDNYEVRTFQVDYTATASPHRYTTRGVR